MKLSRPLLSTALLSTIVSASPISDQKREALPCYVERGTDHFGSDFAQFNTVSFDACSAACQADSRCVTAQYTSDDGQCYLKDELNAATSVSRVDTAVCRPPPCTIVRDTDYFGGDYDAISVASFEICAQTCQYDARCVTAQYTQDNNICYLKSTLTSASSDARVDSVLCKGVVPPLVSTTTGTSASTTGTITVTTVATTTTSQTPGPSACTIVRNTDYFGGDYDAFYTDSFESCAQACQGDSRCVTAQFAKNTNMCYLKSVLNDASVDADVDSVICRGPQPSTTSTTTTVASTTTTTTTTAETTTTSTTTAETTTTTVATTTTSQASEPTVCSIVRDTDHFGGDYDSFSTGTFEQCVQACQGNSRCITAQYAKNTNICYLKSILNEASSNILVDTAICRPPPSATTPTTTAASTSASTTSTTTVATTTTSSAPAPSCTIVRGVDHFGGDYDSISASTFEACVSACQQDSECVTAQFRVALQRCYLKNILTQESADANVDTVICRGPAQPATTTMTTTTTTSVTTSAAASTTAAIVRNCYSLTGGLASDSSRFTIQAVIAVDPTRTCSTPSIGSGFKIIDTTGTFLGFQSISFDPSSTVGSADYCLFPLQSRFLTIGGTNFIANGITYNLFSVVVSPGVFSYMFSTTGDKAGNELSLVLGPAQECPAVVATTTTTTSSISTMTTTMTTPVSTITTTTTPAITTSTMAPALTTTTTTPLPTTATTSGTTTTTAPTTTFTTTTTTATTSQVWTAD